MEGGGTHYLYISFSSKDVKDANNVKCFEATPRTRDPNVFALYQGAAFAVDVVSSLLNNTYGPIPLQETPPTDEGSHRNLRQLLNNAFGAKQHRVWIHVDNHDYKDMTRGKCQLLFSEGFFSCLATIAEVVIATDVERPFAIPIRGCAYCIRLPVVLPVFDIDKIIASQPQLHFRELPHVTKMSASGPVHRNLLRLVATLKVRLAFRILQFGLLDFYHYPSRNADVVAFKKEFQICMNSPSDGANVAAALNNCINLCASDYSYFKNVTTPGVIKHLDGGWVGDHGWGAWGPAEPCIEDIVVLSTFGGISLSFSRLLNSADAEYMVYNDGKQLFLNVLTSKSATSLSSERGSPLEAAYAWSLACGSGLSGKFHFQDGYDTTSFTTRCKRIVAGRIFPTDNDSIYNIDHLEPDIMYQAIERCEGGNTPDHPLAKLFFKTSDNELVLIDITGGQDSAAIGARLAAWIVREQENIKHLKLYGVVLAPFDTTHDEVPKKRRGWEDRDARLTVVSGDDARRCLCSLQQIADWLR